MHADTADTVPVYLRPEFRDVLIANEYVRDKSGDV